MFHHQTTQILGVVDSAKTGMGRTKLVKATTFGEEGFWLHARLLKLTVMQWLHVNPNSDFSTFRHFFG